MSQDKQSLVDRLEAKAKDLGAWDGYPETAELLREAARTIRLNEYGHVNGKLPARLRVERTEAECFMVEAAMFVGFEMTDDDGEKFSCTADQIIDLMTRARDHGRQYGRLEKGLGDLMIGEKHCHAAMSAVNMRVTAQYAANNGEDTDGIRELREIASDFENAFRMFANLRLEREREKSNG